MRTIPLGPTDIRVPIVAAGMMRIADRTDEDVRALYTAAREVGVNFFDHADIYGSNEPGGQLHLCEQRFASALRLSSSEREQIMLQTKASIVVDPWHYYDQSYKHIVAAAEGSLSSLSTDYLDVFLLHRPDALIEPDEVAFRVRDW